MNPIKYQEFHANGQLWIDGQIIVVTGLFQYLYDYRTNFKGYEGEAVARVGIWTKYHNNGQIAWQQDYGDGKLKSDYIKKDLPQYRRDGIMITM